MRDDDNFPVGKVIGFSVLFVIAMIVFGWVIFGMNVATSGIQGRGDQIIQNNSAANRTFQYEHFLKLDGDIRSLAEQADLARQNLASFVQQNPNASADTFQMGQERMQLQQNATGAQQICISTVNEYNNASQSFLAKQFIDARLPPAFSVGVCSNVNQLPASISGQ